MSTETYKIKKEDYKNSDHCECGHTWAAHGSSGRICAACPCKQFVLKNAGTKEGV